MGDKRVRAFRRWRAKPAGASTAAPDAPEAPAEPVPEPVTTGPVLANPLPQRQRVPSGERAVPAEGADIRDLATMMDFLRREN